jgi:hypothetical protein
MLIVWATLLQQDGALSAVRVVLALVLVVLASSLALGICFGLMRRIQTISPPKGDPRNQQNEPRSHAKSREGKDSQA